MSISRKAEFAAKAKLLRIRRRPEIQNRRNSVYASQLFAFLTGKACAVNREDVIFERKYRDPSIGKIEVFKATFNGHAFDVSAIMAKLVGKTRCLQTTNLGDVKEEFSETVTIVRIDSFEIRGDSIFASVYYWTPWGNIPFTFYGLEGKQIRLSVIHTADGNHVLAVGNFRLTNRSGSDLQGQVTTLSNEDEFNWVKRLSEEEVVKIREHYRQLGGIPTRLEDINIPDYRGRFFPQA
jgi:hypothetical protein